jgi:hypothetical protein
MHSLIRDCKPMLLQREDHAEKQAFNLHCLEISTYCPCSPASSCSERHVDHETGR